MERRTEDLGVVVRVWGGGCRQAGVGVLYMAGSDVGMMRRSCAKACLCDNQEGTKQITRGACLRRRRSSSEQLEADPWRESRYERSVSSVHNDDICWLPLRARSQCQGSRHRFDNYYGTARLRPCCKSDCRLSKTPCLTRPRQDESSCIAADLVLYVYLNGSKPPRKVHLHRMQVTG